MLHVGIYDACWYLRCMLVFTMHVGIYDACWYLRCMLVFTMNAGIYDACWYLRSMLVFKMHAGIYNALFAVYSYARGTNATCSCLRCKNFWVTRNFRDF